MNEGIREFQPTEDHSEIDLDLELEEKEQVKTKEIRERRYVLELSGINEEKLKKYYKQEEKHIMSRTMTQSGTTKYPLDLQRTVEAYVKALLKNYLKKSLEHGSIWEKNSGLSMPDYDTNKIAGDILELQKKRQNGESLSPIILELPKIIEKRKKYKGKGTWWKSGWHDSSFDRQKQTMEKNWLDTVKRLEEAGFIARLRVETSKRNAPIVPNNNTSLGYEHDDLQLDISKNDITGGKRPEPDDSRVLPFNQSEKTRARADNSKPRQKERRSKEIRKLKRQPPNVEPMEK